MPEADYLYDGYIYHSELPKTQVFLVRKSIQRFWMNIGGYDGAGMVLPDYIQIAPLVASEIWVLLRIIPVRSGYINLGIAVLRLTGGHSNSWSSRGDAATYAYVFNFNATSVLTSAGPTEYSHGVPLRCLSTVLGM